MAFAQAYDVSITTATGGTGTGYTPVVNGLISAVIYTADGTSPFEATTDITVTTEDTGQAVLTETNVTGSAKWYPMAEGELNSGSASTITEAAIYAAGERIKIAVAQGGNTKTGAFKVVIA